MPTVFVIHDNPQTPRNFNPAEQFGKVKICISAFVNSHAIEHWKEVLRKELNGLTNEDWLILTGNPALMGIAADYMGSRVGVLRFLIWDAQTKSYFPYETEAND